jgi:precorrin-6B methylase 2
LYEKYETNLEYDFSNRLLEGKTSETEYPLYERFTRLIEAEVALANVCENDRVLFIGSGPFPISAILISKFTSVNVYCIDKSQRACETSLEVVDHLGLGDKIKVKRDSGETSSLFGYDVVFVALLAQPKEKIFDCIWRHAPQNTRVICRTSDGVREAFYRGIASKRLTDFRHFRLMGQHKAADGDTISSLFFKIDRNIDTR